VTLGSAVDTLPDLLTSLDPIITSDGLIHGIAMAADGRATRGFDYNPQIRKLTVFPLPPDLNGWFHEVRLNADATFVAYVAHVKSGQTWAVIRSWPDLSPVARTAASEGFPSDVGYDLVEWLGPTRFRISYRISSGPSIVVEGRSRSGAMKVDTVGICDEACNRGSSSCGRPRDGHHYRWKPSGVFHNP
jgi:hypothetical protein